MKSILDKSFRYVHSSKTDVGKTIRREINRLKELAELEAAEQAAKVRPIKRGTK